MGRLLMYLIMAAVLLVGVMLIRFSAELYRGLPADLDTPPEVVPFEDWREYVSAVGSFKVLLPVLPQHASEQLAVPDTTYFLEYNMYVAEENDGTTYLISLIRYPDELNTDNHAAMLENVMNEMVAANPTNELSSAGFVEYLGFNALAFKIVSPETVVNSRAFVNGKEMYLLTVIDKTGGYKEGDFEYFLENFVLIEGGEGS